MSRLLGIGYNKILAKSFQRTTLVFLSLVLIFTIAMPNQVMAIWPFDKTRQPSVLQAQKVDTVKTQKISDLNPVSTELTTPKKVDRTPKKEIISKREAFSSTFINADGTRTLKYSSIQKNFKKGSSWEKINNTLKTKDQVKPTKSLTDIITGTTPIGPSPESFSGEAGIIKTNMKPFSEGIELSFGEKKLVMKPVGANNVKPEQKNDYTVIYRNAWPGVDAEYQLRGEIVKEQLVIKNKNAKSEFDFVIEGGKLYNHPTRTGELAIEGVNPAEFSFSSLTLDVNGRGVISEQRATQAVTKNGLKVTVDKAWMKAQSKDSFPMIVDPSFYRYNDVGQMFKSDGYACNQTNCHFNTGTLNDGAGWKHWRTYFTFNYAQASGKNLLYARLQMPMVGGINGDASNRTLNMSWANCISFHCVGHGTRTSAVVGTWADMNITEVIRPHLANSSSGAWFGIWGEEGPYKTYKPFYEMHIDVYYDTPTPMAAATAPADKQVTVSTQPTLQVNPVADGDGEGVQYYYRVSTNSDAETGAVINSGWINTNQWTIPDGILQDGTTYYWHVYTKGTSDTGQQTNPNWVRSFKVDLRTGKDSTQAYDTVGPIGIDLATGNATTSTDTHSMNALGGKIGLNLDYNTPTKAKNGLIGEYWNVSSGNTEPSGNPVITRYDDNINFTWSHGTSPGPGVNADWFSGRWKGYFVAPTTGTYHFGTSMDDAVNIQVNNQDVTGGCYGNSPCYGNGITLQSGQVVPIQVKFVEATGDGYVRLYVKGAVPEQIVPREWLRTEVQPSVAQYGLKGRYYTDDGSHNFPGNDSDPMRFMMARNDNKLSFHWGANGPAAGLQGDSWMAKWTGYITVPESGNYTFGADTDDGVRVKLNNGLLGAEQTVLNSWQTQATTVWGNATNLTAGQQVPITVEYFEGGGGAAFRLLARGPNLPDQEIPVKWLTPKAEALPDAWRLGVDVDGNVNYERLRVAGQNVILEDSTRATHEYSWTGSGFKPPVNEDGQLIRNADSTYTLIDTDGRTYIFDAEGKLKLVTTPTDDRNPASLKYEYSGDPSRLVKIIDGVTSSRFGTLHYKGTPTEEGNCSTPSGFDAAPDGMLCAFKTSDGDITRLYYKSGQLSRVEKPGNERTDYGYDTLGRIIATRDSIANDVITTSVRADNEEVLTQLTYDSIGRASAIKAPAPTAGANRTNHTLEYSPIDTQPIYRYWKSPDSRESTRPAVEGHDQIINQGSVLSTQKPGTKALYSCQISWDEFASLDSNCEGQTKIGLLGYIYDTPPADVPTTVLQRCVYIPSGDHFVWTDTGCDTRHNEGTLGYALANTSYVGSTKMHITGANESHGFSKRIEYDNLLRTTKETDVTNLSTTTQWDSVKDLQLSKTDPTGLKSTTIYDDDDRPVENYGPAPSAWYGSDRKPSPAQLNNVPKATTGYDEGMSGLGVAYMASNAPQPSDTLPSEQTLTKEQTLWSLDRRFRFVYQNDGNLVLYGPDNVVKWTSNTAGQASNRLVMQHDGNLVLYNNNTPVWVAGTQAGVTSARFTIQNDGNAVVYRSNGSVWATNTGGTAPTGASKAALTGAPLLHTTNIATNGTISKNFGSTSPIPNHSGSWGMRMTGKMRLPSAGNWNFRVWSDNGVRVWIDDQLVLDDWIDGPQRFHSTFSYNNTANTIHRIKVDYYHTNGDAVFNLYATPPGGGETTNVAQYFNPSYGLKTSQTVHDSQLGNDNSTITYSKPEYGLVDKTTFDPSGLNLQTTNTYETPGAIGSFLRQTSKTLPGGTTINYQHYNASDVKDNPCTETVEAFHQAGLAKGKIEADPDGVGSQTPRSNETIYNESGDIVASRYNTDPWTCISYDNRGRVLKTILPAVGSKPGRIITNDHAKDGNPLITTTSDETGTIRVENDILGRTIRYIDSQGKVTNNVYDDFGKLMSRTSPLGVESYEYDNYDRMVVYKLDGIAYATLSYDQYGRQAGVQYRDGLSLNNIQRDQLGRLNKINYLASSQSISDEVTRSQSGKVISGVENGVVKNYSYDQAGRLTNATIGSNNYSYEFGNQDPGCVNTAGNNTNAHLNSNRTKLVINGVTTTYCYDAADRLMSSSDAKFTNAEYDSHGNTTSIGSTTLRTELGYDVNDRNSSIKESANGITTKEVLYERDVKDRIISREYKTGGQTQSKNKYGFTADGDSPDFLLNENGEVVQKYISLPGGVSITIKPQSTSSGAKQYSISNIHGDTMATIDADGAVTGFYMSGPFGEAIANQPQPSNTVTGATWGYLGHFMKTNDKEFAISPTQMGARVYIAGLGRFMSVDPVEGGMLNSYVYAQDPLNQSDLDGKGLFGIIFRFVAAKVKKVVSRAAPFYTHYLSGGGKPVKSPASSYSWSKPPALKAAISNAKGKQGTQQIKINKTAITPKDLAGKAIIGGATANVSGTLTVRGNQWTFKGTMTINPDSYDFKPRPGRSWLEDRATEVGLAGGQIANSASFGYIKPQDYEHVITGEIKIDESGTY